MIYIIEYLENGEEKTLRCHENLLEYKLSKLRIKGCEIITYYEEEK